MAKIKKPAEKQPEVMAVKGVARNTKKLSQQDVALQVHNTKRKDSSKVKAKTKEKIEPAQSRAVKRTDASGRDMDKHKRHRLANMLKPFEIQVRQLLTNRGHLPQNLLTSIIQRDWHKRYNDEISTEVARTLKGVEFHPISSLKLKNRGGISFAMYVTDSAARVGIVIIEPGNKKTKSSTGQTIRFTVLYGIATFLCDGIREDYRSGNIFTIPPNVTYSIRNRGREPCYLNFFSYGLENGEQ